MEYISQDGWLLIGLAVFFIIFGIASAIHVMNKYPPERVFPDSMEDSSSIDGPVDDDDD